MLENIQEKTIPSNSEYKILLHFLVKWNIIPSKAFILSKTYLCLKIIFETPISSQINLDKRQHEVRIQQLENEIHYLQENLKNMEEIQGLTDLQLQEADEEKERILAQLQELEKKVGNTRKVRHMSSCCFILPPAIRPAEKGFWSTVASGCIASLPPRCETDWREIWIYVIESRDWDNGAIIDGKK